MVWERAHRVSGRSAALLGIVLSVLVSLLGLWSPSAAQAALSISVSGNHFVNGSGQTIRLLGVNHPSFEYACADGYAYSDGHMDDADASAIASWNANAVRVPLNEDCWLGLNGLPDSNEGATPPLTQAGYQQAVEAYVAALHAHGLYAILDLHWSAPGTQAAFEQQPMPDDHSAAFWTSVASTFAGDPAVVFDVFNEPYSPTDLRSGSDPNPGDAVGWSCWKNGGCTTQAYDDSGKPTTTYAVVGMQALVTAIRAAGARQPVLVGGLNYANDLTGWIANAPDDPLDQEAASFHNYMGQACDDVACWNGQIAPVAANVPVVTGEFDEDDYLETNCADHAASTFDADYMAWADANGVSYTAWGWIVDDQAQMDADGCSSFDLIGDYSGTPLAPNGSLLHDHLLTLPAGGVTAVTTVTPPTGVSPPTTTTSAEAQALVVKVASASKATVEQLARTGLLSTVTCNQACRITVRVYVTAAQAKTLGLRSKRSKLKHDVLIGSASARTAKPGKVVLRVRLSAKVLARLAKHRTSRLLSSVTSQSGQSAKTVTKRITVTG